MSKILDMDLDKLASRVRRSHSYSKKRVDKDITKQDAIKLKHLIL
jgi:hypothetical protein